MNTIIRMRCIDQVLTFESTPVIASGGLEENVLQVEFCSKWDGLSKTAVFWRKEGEAYHVPMGVDEGFTIPWEVLADEGVFYFGVFGASDDGRLRTSETVRYTVAQGAITSGTKPSDPTPDIYAQLLAMYGEVRDIAARSATAAEASREAAERAVEGSVPITRKVNGKALSEDITLGAADVGARPADWTPDAADVGAVPTTRKVNGKALSANITLGPADVGARPADWTPDAAAVGAVPTTRKVNNKALSADITLGPADVGARPADWMPDAAAVGARPADWMPTLAAIGDACATADKAAEMGVDLLVKKTTPRMILTNNSNSSEVRFSNNTNAAVMQAKAGGKDKYRQLRLVNEANGDSPTGDLSKVLQLFSNVAGESGATRYILHSGNFTDFGAAKIECGSYVGTGTCGPENPTIITFSFVPKMLWVWADGDCPTGTRGSGYALPCTNLNETNKRVQMLGGYANAIMMRMAGPVVAFYGTSGHWGVEEDGEDEDVFYYDGADEQLNASGITYHYLAIG